MGMDNIFAILIAAAGFLWTLFRDKSTDVQELYERIARLESSVDTLGTEFSRLEKQQGELEKTLDALQNQIHKLDLKIERIITILENNKGA